MIDIYHRKFGNSRFFHEMKVRLKFNQKLLFLILITNYTCYNKQLFKLKKDY